MKAEAALVTSQTSRAVGLGGVTLETETVSAALTSFSKGRREGGIQKLPGSGLMFPSGTFCRRGYQVRGLWTAGQSNSYYWESPWA